MKKSLWVFFAFGFSTCAIEPQISPASYELCYDICMSPYAGGENLLFCNRLIEQGLCSLDNKMGIAHSRSQFARVYRLSQMIAIYLPLNYFSSIVQHEVFGHGYRIRDINGNTMHVVGYEFDFPPPYGLGNGATNFSFFPNKVTTTDLTAVSIAGVEAQSILAWQTKCKWLEANRIDPRQTILYFVSELALNLYASDANLDANERIGHDLAEYVETLNYTYTASQLTTARIRALSWINFGDPFLFYSLYSWFRYIFTGSETPIPMIPMFGYGYLPGARLGLTPFGPEVFLDNFLLKKKEPIYFYIKGGSHANNIYSGLGFFAPCLWSFGRWNLGIRFDGWRQPKLLLEQGAIPLMEVDFREPPNTENPLYSAREQHDMRYGCAGSLLGSFRPYRWLGFQIELGMKSKGYLPGYMLETSPTLRASYLANF